MTRTLLRGALTVAHALATVAQADAATGTTARSSNVASLRPSMPISTNTCTGSRPPIRRQRSGQDRRTHHRYRLDGLEARNRADPDIYLVTESKNWAALDLLCASFDQVRARSRSVEKGAQSEADRAKIRTVLAHGPSRKTLSKAQRGRRRSAARLCLPASVPAQ